MKKIILFSIVAIFALNNKSVAQGCVAIRSNGNTCSMGSPAAAKGWLMNINNRYFKSHRHFVGTIEQKEREIQELKERQRSIQQPDTTSRTYNSEPESMDVKDDGTVAATSSPIISLVNWF